MARGRRRLCATAEERLEGAPAAIERLKYRTVNGPPGDRRFNKAVYTVNKIDDLCRGKLKRTVAVELAAGEALDKLRGMLARNEDLSLPEFRGLMGTIGAGLASVWDGPMAGFGSGLLLGVMRLQMKHERTMARLAVRAAAPEIKAKGIAAIAAAHRRAKKRREQIETPWLKDHDKGLKLQ